MSLSGGGDRPRSQVAKEPFPADFRFPPEAVAAAKAAPRNLSEADIARTLTSFRKRAGDGQDTAAGWTKRGAAYLATVEAKPVDGNEFVMVRGPMGDEVSKPLRFLDAGTAYIRANGDRGRTPGKAGSQTIL